MSKEVEKYYVKRGEEVIDSLFDKGYFRDDVTRKELKALQEIMLGMLPEKQYTTVGLVVDPHDLSKGPEGKIPIQNEFNRAIKLMEQNIRGGFKV